MTKTCYLLQLGTLPYEEALEIQEKLVELRLAGKIPDTLILVEHPPVITLGRRLHGAYQQSLRISKDELQQRGISIHEINRGGHATYHGPGQIVGYPIIEIADGKAGAAPYMDNLCHVMMSVLESYGVDSRLDKGVWVDDKKIGATGAAIVSSSGKHVTMHGFALNVNTDLSTFEFIVSCGMPDKSPTSLEQALGREVDIEEVSHLLAESFKEQLGYDTIQEITFDDIQEI